LGRSYHIISFLFTEIAISVNSKFNRITYAALIKYPFSASFSTQRIYQAERINAGEKASASLSLHHHVATACLKVLRKTGFPIAGLHETASNIGVSHIKPA